MTASAQSDTGIEPDAYVPDFELVKALADRVTAFYDASARLEQVCGTAAIEAWPEIQDLDDGQIEMLFEEIVEVLAARDNGRRR